MRRSLFLSAVALAALAFAGANWPQFRGPDFRASTDEGKLPATFSEQENLRWKVKLPGPGASSPIIFGDRVYVTCYSGYGVSAESPGNRGDLVRHLLCLNRKDGTEIWRADMKTDSRETDYRGMMTQHGYASSTPATDGERIYVFLGSGGVWAFDKEGKKAWQASVGTGTDGWGSASSVVLTDDLVIVNAAVESKAIVALKKTDGSEAWKFTVRGRSWSTPAIVKSPDGKPEVVVSVEGRVSGLDPASGKELWYCDGIRDYTCPSVTAGDGVAYVSGGRQSRIVAVKTGGSGDVTDTHKLWEKVMGGNVTTPALVGDKLFGVSDRSIAYCLDAKTGDTIYQTRLASSSNAPAGDAPPRDRPREGADRPEREAPRGDRPQADRPPPGRPGFGQGGPGGRRGGFGGGRGGFGGGMGGGLYASVVHADGKLFAVTRTSGIYVLAAEPEYKVLAHNTMDDDKSRFDATPSVADNQLFVRSEQNLYCIGLDGAE